MQNQQRILSPLHVDTGDRAPRAADQKQPVFLIADLFIELGQGFIDMRAPAFGTAFDFPQLERAKVTGHAVADLAIVDLGQLHRGSADITDEPIGARPAQQHALC